MHSEHEAQAIIEDMTDSQYYCVNCQQVFEYRYDEQYGCEQCNAAISDRNIAGEDY